MHKGLLLGFLFAVLPVPAGVPAIGAPAAAPFLVKGGTLVDSNKGHGIEAIDETFLYSGDFSGPYLGGGFGGFSAGIVTIDGVAGYNLAVAPNVILGGEATLGLQLPSNTFELWLSGKAGTPINSNLLIYGTAGLGTIGGTPVYNAGLGGTFVLGNDLGIDLSGVVRGPVGVAPIEFGVRAKVLWWPETQIGTHTDWYPYRSGDPFALELGSSWTGPYNAVDLGAVVHLPSLTESGLLDVALRANAGVQLSTASPEVFGGIQLGVKAAPNIQVYGFGDLGLIGSTPVNVLGVGSSIWVGPGVSIRPELFLRGPTGSITEGGGRVSMYFDLIQGMRERNITPTKFDALRVFWR